MARSTLICQIPAGFRFAANSNKGIIHDIPQSFLFQDVLAWRINSMALNLARWITLKSHLARWILLRGFCLTSKREKRKKRRYRELLSLAISGERREIQCCKRKPKANQSASFRGVALFFSLRNQF